MDEGDLHSPLAAREPANKGPEISCQFPGRHLSAGECASEVSHLNPNPLTLTLPLLQNATISYARREVQLFLTRVSIFSSAMSDAHPHQTCELCFEGTTLQAEKEPYHSTALLKTYGATATISHCHSADCAPALQLLKPSSVRMKTLFPSAQASRFSSNLL